MAIIEMGYFKDSFKSIHDIDAISDTNDHKPRESFPKENHNNRSIIVYGSMIEDAYPAFQLGAAAFLPKEISKKNYEKILDQALTNIFGTQICPHCALYKEFYLEKSKKEHLISQYLVESYHLTQSESEICLSIKEFANKDAVANQHKIKISTLKAH